MLIAVILIAGCAHNPDQFYFGNYSEAERFYAKGQYDRAIQKYQSYIDENPEGNLAVIAAYYMGRSHQALGHIDEAKIIYESIVNNHKDLVWANFSETQLKELASASSRPAAPTQVK